MLFHYFDLIGLVITKDQIVATFVVADGCCFPLNGSSLEEESVRSSLEEESVLVVESSRRGVLPNIESDIDR